MLRGTGGLRKVGVYQTLPRVVLGGVCVGADVRGLLGAHAVAAAAAGEHLLHRPAGIQQLQVG
jgi:hypothetical protein